jgi:hypothetical protein
MLPMPMTGLFWFSHDLRLYDNPALALAARAVERLVCVYCVDSADTAPNRYGLRSLGAHRAQFLRESLGELGYDNVTVKLGDGYFGWQEHAPFDAIVVTAAASHVPPPLIEQLKPGGYMIIPVGGRWMVQQLLLIEKTMDGEIVTRQKGAVRFVPLTGEH